MGTYSTVIRIPCRIPAGQIYSSILNSNETYGNLAGVSIESPPVLPEGIEIQVSSDHRATSASQWNGWFDGNPPTQMVVPAAGTTQPYGTLVNNGSVRLHSTTGVVAAERLFYFVGESTT